MARPVSIVSALSSLTSSLDFAHAEGLYRLPVFRIKAVLHEIRVKASVTPRFIGKHEVTQRRTSC